MGLVRIVDQKLAGRVRDLVLGREKFFLERITNLGDINTLYVETREAGFGLDWERPLPAWRPGAAFYVTAGLGVQPKRQLN